MGLHLTLKVDSFVKGFTPTKDMLTGKTYSGYCPNYLNNNNHISACGKILKIKEVEPQVGFFKVKTEEAILNVFVHSY